MAHIPVLANEIVRYLKPESGKNYIDCTVGEGGHAELILSLSAPDGLLLGIDKDKTILERAGQKLERFGNRKILIQGSYDDLSKIISINNFSNIYGILFDLGISSYHIEESGRGFSFLTDEPLDMRFDPESEATAKNILEQWSAQDLEELFKRYGEKVYAKNVAEEIVRNRTREEIRTTQDLVRIINRTKKNKNEKIHPATKIFQALRIAANSELERLRDVLPQAFSKLEIGGRVAVISYHSIEDGIVKNFLLNEEKNKKIKILTDKPVVPSAIEQKENSRSRSAKLRVAEKI